MIVKGRELVRFVSTLSQFLLLFLPSLLPLPSSPPIFFFLLIFYIYIYIFLLLLLFFFLFYVPFFHRCWPSRARAICASDDLFAVIKETKPTNDSDRLAILLNGVCLASHCHDDGELAGILWTHQARVHEAE